MMNILTRLFKAAWCRIIHAQHTARPLYHCLQFNSPLLCKCDICGRIWIEDD